MRSWIGSAFMAVAIVITASIFSGAWKKTHDTTEIIRVTGLAEKNFTSDLIVWNGYFSRRSMSMQEAYAALKKDGDDIRRYLVSKGIPNERILFSAASINKEYRSIINDKGMQVGQEFDGYTISQSVGVESNEIDKVEAMSREVTELINSGIELTSNPPQFFYTKLADLKIELLAAAAKDAKNRADKIAENAGGDLGKLRSASMGVFQITAQNSNEEFSYGGSFNTASKQKTASITTKVEFDVD
jgi:uncharacterized protein